MLRNLHCERVHCAHAEVFADDDRMTRDAVSFETRHGARRKIEQDVFDKSASDQSVRSSCDSIFIVALFLPENSALVRLRRFLSLAKQPEATRRADPQPARIETIRHG